MAESLQSLEAKLARLEQRVEDDSRTNARDYEISRRLLEDQAIIKERVGASVKRINECLAKYNELDKYLRKREQEQIKERKADRRWLITTMIACAGIIIAALSLLVDKF